MPNPNSGNQRVAAPKQGHTNREISGALAFLIDAVEQHGVTNVAFFGYSHGGGSVRLLMQALAKKASTDQHLAQILVGTELSRRLNIFWGAYIDAVHINLSGNTNLSSTGTPFSETQFPDAVVGQFGLDTVISPDAFINIYQDWTVPNFRGFTPVSGAALHLADWTYDGNLAEDFTQYYTDSQANAGLWPGGTDHTNNKHHGIAESQETQILVESSFDNAAMKYNNLG